MSGYALLTLLFCLLSVIGIRMISNVRSNFLSIESETIPVVLTINHIYGSGLRIIATASEIGQFHLLGSTGTGVTPSAPPSVSGLQPFAAAKEELAKNLAHYEKLVAKYFLTETPYLEQIRHTSARIVALSEAIVVKRLEKAAEPEIVALKEQLKESEHDFTFTVEKILAHETAEIHERGDYTNFLFTATIRLFTFSLIIILLAALAVGFIIARNITHPLDALVHAANDIANGNYHARVESGPGNNEVGKLAEAFNAMMAKIEQYNTGLQQMVDNQTEQLLKANKSLQHEINRHQEARHGMKELENQLMDIQKMEAIGTLAGGIAHDFNNILTAQLGYTDLCLLDAEPDTPLSRRLSEIKKAGLRATELTRQILTFSRQNKFDLAPVQIKSIVREVIKLIRSTIPTTITIESEISPAAQNSLVMGDATRLHQIIMNLCTNAYHAMREQGGTLRISLELVEINPGHPLIKNTALHSGNYLKLAIQDTGHGMEPQVRERIFEPYFTTKNRDEGTGMGLSVVHGIVKRFEGQIEVESEPGQGSTFNIYLPQVETDSELYKESAARPLLKGSERILFIDDEMIIAQMQEELLGNIGYKVTAITSSTEALRLFKAQPDGFDLVITDMTMPNMTGATLAGKILEIRPEMPIILCTGFSDSIDKEKARALGIREFLFKPLILGKMALTIRQVIDGKPAAAAENICS